MSQADRREATRRTDFANLVAMFRWQDIIESDRAAVRALACTDTLGDLAARVADLQCGFTGQEGQPEPTETELIAALVTMPAFLTALGGVANDQRVSLPSWVRVAVERRGMPVQANDSKEVA